MGSGFNCTCKNCGYSFSANLGIGMLFPLRYEECKEKMKTGEYGKQGMDFFEKYPKGAIDCEEVVAYCKTCGKFHQVTDLTMYRPKKDYIPENNDHTSGCSGTYPIKESDYATHWDLGIHYEKYEDYQHLCPDCKKEMTIIQDYGEKLDNGELDCPKCQKEKLSVTGYVMWD